MKKPIIGITTDMKDENLFVKHHYSDAIAKTGGIPLLLPLVNDTKSYAEIISGLLIPGGDDLDPFYYNETVMSQPKLVSRKRSDFEISLLKDVINLRKPVLGICYGMQLINVFLGGTLYQDIDKQLKVEINHKKGYHIIVITENGFLEKGKFSVNSTHHQAIKKIGTSLLAFAYSTDDMIEAFYLENYPFLIGVQWHPERMLNDELSLRLFESFVEESYVSK